VDNKEFLNDVLNMKLMVVACLGVAYLLSQDRAVILPMEKKKSSVQNRYEHKDNCEAGIKWGKSETRVLTL